MSPTRNMAASVHARLLRLSREKREDFNFILQRYAAERFLFRLGQSKYRENFVLKGAMLFPLWGGSVYRPTRDLDFTGYGENEVAVVVSCFREVCSLPVPDDGLHFHGSTLAAVQIREDSEYNGLRVRFVATLGEARIPMQIDIGFGNAIEPQACEIEYPTLLGAAAPRIRAYPPEAVVAEKFHALAVLGGGNSRMKDLYDLYVIAGQFRFEGETLTRAVQATFQRRGTEIATALPAGLTPRFFADETRGERWRAYCNLNSLPGAPQDLQRVGEQLRAFLSPVWDSLASEGQPLGQWPAGGPWQTGERDDG